MQATQKQYDELAKAFQIGQTGSEEGWDDLAIDPQWMREENLPVEKRETLDDFRAASQEWAETCPCEEICGGLYWERVQVRKGQERVSLAVIDCGDYRLVYQQ